MRPQTSSSRGRLWTVPCPNPWPTESMSIIKWLFFNAATFWVISYAVIWIHCLYWHLERQLRANLLYHHVPSILTTKYFSPKQPLVDSSSKQLLWLPLSFNHVLPSQNHSSTHVDSAICILFKSKLERTPLDSDSAEHGFPQPLCFTALNFKHKKNNSNLAHRMTEVK